MLAATTPARVKVICAPDRMTAELRAIPGSDASRPIACEELAAAIELAGLQPIERVELERISAGLNDGTLSTPQVLIRGTPPADDVPAKLELAPELLCAPETPASHYERHHYLTAAAGQCVAKVIPRVPGHDGIDVVGQVIPHRTLGTTPTYTLGQNVTLQADGSVIAAISGSVRLDKGKLWIDPVLEIAKNVDFSVGNVDFGGDVHIRGSVLDLFHVRSRRSIFIHGAVEAAEITAGADIVVDGGIIGKEKGRCSAGRDLTLRHATSAILRAGNDIHGHIEIATSHVECGGLLDMKEGTILGGQIRARGGIRCGTLGCPHGTATVVEVGTDPALRRSVIEQMGNLKKLQKTARAARDAAAPLLRNQHSLNAQQREMLTQLLFEATEAETTANTIMRTLHEQFAASRAAAKQEIRVTKKIHPGVTIRFPEMECTIDEVLLGPLRIVPLTVETHGTMICAVSEHAGHTRHLHTRHTRDDLMHAAEHALNPSAERMKAEG
jgi:uncharacterized protein (DUF342 family)